MDFDLQGIWSTAGGAAAALLVGYIFGFLQSIAPFIPSTGVARNWVLAFLAGGIVLLAGLTSGHTLNEANAIANVFSGLLVFIGIYLAALKAAEAGTGTAVKTIEGAQSVSSGG